MLIRRESPAEAVTISELITEAFRAAQYAGGNEATIVEQLRAADALVLSLVAEAAEGGIVGHVAASRAEVGGREGWYVIAPLAVRLSHRRHGVGAALMREAIGRLANRSASGLVLVGDPAYYGRFGFRAVPGLVWPGIPEAYGLALPLRPGAGIEGGKVRCHPAFGLTED